MTRAYPNPHGEQTILTTTPPERQPNVYCLAYGREWQTDDLIDAVEQA